MHRFLALSSIALTLALCGCATTKQPEPDKTIKTSSVIAPEGKSPAGKDEEDADVPDHGGWHHLAGRTLEVSSLSELKLHDKEVILSFDDGPIPGRTDKVLAVLDRFGVKGAFMMVGEMAELHPQLARRIAQDGNAIGSHTYRHADLGTMSFDAAMKEVAKGQLAVTKATGEDVNFFRFPYLAESRKLRAAIAMRDMVVMDVDIDSKDYFNTTPVAVHQTHDGRAAQARPRHHPDARHSQAHRNDVAGAAFETRSGRLQGSDAEIQKELRAGGNGFALIAMTCPRTAF